MAMPPADRKADAIKQWAAVGLSFLVIVILFEIEFVPGSMIRHHLPADGTTRSNTPGSVQKAVELSPSFLVHKQELERRLKALNLAWIKFRQDAKDLTGADVSLPISSSARSVTFSDTVASTAWSDILATSPRIASQLSDAQRFLDGLSGQANAGKTLNTDDQCALDYIAKLTLAQDAMDRMEAELGHIDLALRTATRPSAAK